MGNKWNFTYFETSAVSGVNVDTSFNCLLYKIISPILNKINKLNSIEKPTEKQVESILTEED
jgi:hypothetical protein